MTDRADIQNVLSQMRALQAQAQQGVAQPMPPQSINEQETGFGDVLKMAVDKVNEQQSVAKAMSEAYERGDPNVDLPQVMISLQKASVSFDAMTQVRNRLVSAYEEISKMAI